ncbi:MAG TPA: DUF5011 domain-containing protein, partial [Candidatus Kaiserbacteria bacterium]|nr:DUF5011 domain-containing protein [Candidatus Kaiserbacteria bacterium]
SNITTTGIISGGNINGDMYYDAIVDASGNGKYTTVNAATAGEAAGASIFIKNGTYVEGANIILKTGQKLVGESREGVILDMTGGYYMRVWGSSGTHLTGILLDSFSITGSNNDTKQLWLYYTDSSIIRNVKSYGTASVRPFAIYIQNSQYNILDGVIADYGHTNFFLKYSDYNKIINSSSFNAEFENYNLQYSTYNALVGNLAKGSGVGIYMRYTSDDNTFTNMTFYGMSGVFAFYNSPNRTIITGVVAVNTTGQAIGEYFGTSADLSLTNSYIEGNVVISGDGFHISNTTVVGTLTIDSTADKTTVSNSAFTSITDNGTNTKIINTSGTGITNSIGDMGNVGIGTTTPGFLLAVERSGAGAVASFTNSNGTCSIDPTSTALVCSSDSRLKKDITKLEYSLDKVLQLNPVRYNWLNATGTDPEQIGLIAQEVQEFFPELVHLNPVDGYYGLSYAGLTPILVSAIQGLNLNLESIASTTASSTPQSQSFAKSFFSNLFTKITNWLADTTNGLTNIFANVFYAKEKICVDNECLTKDDIRKILELTNGQSATVAPTVDVSILSDQSADQADTEAPVISITGNNPAEILIGATYSDLGVTVADNVDKNLRYKVSLDGGDEIYPDKLYIDTSTSTTYTITYTTTDQAGNVGNAERIVIVSAQEEKGIQVEEITVEEVIKELTEESVGEVDKAIEDVIQKSIKDSIKEGGDVTKDITDKSAEPVKEDGKVEKKTQQEETPSEDLSSKPQSKN